MPWNWFQDKDSSFLRERSAGGRKTGIGVAQSGIGIDVPRRRCGFHAPGRAGCSPPPAGQGAHAEATPSGCRLRSGNKLRQPRAERATQAETGIGVVFPGIGLGGGAARCATFVSDGTEHRRCGSSTRNFCTHHTTLRPTGIRGRPPRGGAPLHRPTNARKKTNSHECKTPYANRPAGGCGDASARARSSCPAKHNTDNHG